MTDIEQHNNQRGRHQMTTEAAPKIIATLEDKRKHLNQRAVELADERNKIAFGAHVEGDAKSRKRLDQINVEITTLSSEAASIDAALTEANTRLATAKRDEALAANRANAVQLREKLARFVELGMQLDDAVWDIGSSVTEMVALVNAMHALGQAAPTSEQFRVNGTMALKTMLQELPQLWINDFGFARLAPNQKKNFKALVEGWSQMIEQNIASRIGETKQTEAA
jgi:hypothetical protein